MLEAKNDGSQRLHACFNGDLVAIVSDVRHLRSLGFVIPREIEEEVKVGSARFCALIRYAGCGSVCFHAVQCSPDRVGTQSGQHCPCTVVNAALPADG